MHRIVFAFFAFVVLTVSAIAGDYCLGGVNSTIRPYPYLAAPQIFYFVGQPVRIEALLEAEKRRDPEYREFLRFKTFRAEFEAYRESGAANPAGETHTSEQGASVGLVASRCVACHGGAAPEGGLFLDGRHALTAPQITAAQRRVLRGEMPPSGKLPEAEMNGVLRELLNMEEAGKSE
jgi:mono/diheme cytochrome c family protein